MTAYLSKATAYPRTTRRADPARIDEARRAASRSRLIGEGMTKVTPDAWVAAWEAQAAQDGPMGGWVFWERGWGNG